MLILTSVPMKVGLMYKLEVFEFGTHSFSISTNRLIHLIISRLSKGGSDDRTAESYMRSMLRSGRNKRKRPSSPR